MDKMAVYNHLPIFLQNAACNAEGRRIMRTRYSKDFWRLLSEYESRADWSYDQLAEFRDARLRKMIHHCYETVPYYHRLFDEGGINPDSIKALEDLKILPLLDKATVNSNPADFISTAVPKDKLVTMHTSGTTGSGFIFKTTQEAICEQWAVWWRYRRALGITFNTKQALFSGQRIVPVFQNRPPYWRTVSPCNQLYFSIIHESENTLEYYYNEIEDNKIVWIHGYPSAISLLAAFMNKHSLTSSNIKFITTGAENLLESQVRSMQCAFNTTPYQHYGAAEGVANFSESIDGSMTVDEDFSAAELLPNEFGYTVVGSTLTNFAMPLLRWNLKDIVTYAEGASGKRQILSISGRQEDYITMPDGRKVGRLDHVFKDTPSIKEAQILQHADYSIEILYASDCDEKIIESDISRAKKILEEMLSADIPIKFERVRQVPRTKSGKLRFVISEVK